MLRGGWIPVPTGPHREPGVQLQNLPAYCHIADVFLLKARPYGAKDYSRSSPKDSCGIYKCKNLATACD